ncbi:MAG: zinc-dependent peptidase [Halorhodospira sp.]
MAWLREWRRRRMIRRRRLTATAWARAEAALPELLQVDLATRQRLEATALVFAAEKEFMAVAGLELDAAAIDTIALQAALPALERGLDWYAPWTTVVLYPAGFVATHEYEDADGIVHVAQDPLIGEAWERGPLVLSLADALEPEPGTSVVIHECAHKLDMRQGEINGLPPLPRSMSIEAWSVAFGRAYEDLQCRLGGGEGEEGDLAGYPLDPYAAQDPGEFFAVATETFFAAPQRLQRGYPQVYAQLAEFYGWSLN